MDQLLFQKEQRQATFHRICLVTSLIIIIALLLFNLHMYRSRKRLQQDEKEMRKLAIIAEAANEIKSRFLANMSYNIRIPPVSYTHLSQYIAGAAYHNYGGNRSELLNIHKLYPNKELLFTETSVSYTHL